MTYRNKFERLYTSHYDDVLRYCLRRTNREDALDTAAETFTVAWRRRDTMPTDHALPWLYGVARFVLANLWRSAERRNNALARMWVVEDSSLEEPEWQLVVDQESRDIVAAISRLRQSDQEIIRLAAWEELSREDLGIALGCTPNTVTKRMNGALDRLACELGAVERTNSRFFGRKGASG